MAGVGSLTSNRRLRIFGSPSVSVQLVLLVAVAVAGIATGATFLLNRPTGPLYGCTSLSNCRAVAGSHHLKPLMLPNTRLVDLRFENGTVDTEQTGVVEPQGDVSLVMNLADLSQSAPTTVMVSADLHRNWVLMCSSPKAHSDTTSPGMRYCSFNFGCDERAIFASKGISYAVDIFGGSSCSSDFPTQSAARIHKILDSFS